MRKLNIKLKSSSYDILIEDGILDKAGDYIKNIYKGKNIFIITDDIVEGLYLNRLAKALASYNIYTTSFKNGEDSKSITTYINLCTSLIENDIRRGDLLIALGGGVTGDMVGFIASTIYRGIDYINIPTTLLSQMDSSIGGKTGIDFYGRKNIIGAFKQPLMVLIDPLLLNTLDNRELNNGMGELIKHGAIGSKDLLLRLKDRPKINEDIIYESLMVKKLVVEADEFDRGDRMKLNFGHTFAHQLELKYGYKHGEAVGIGMLMALRMGMDLGITKKEDYELILDTLRAYSLPLEYYDYKDYLKTAIYDKKNIAGVISFILLKNIGEAIIYKIDEKSLKEVA